MATIAIRKELGMLHLGRHFFFDDCRAWWSLRSTDTLLIDKELILNRKSNLLNRHLDFKGGSSRQICNGKGAIEALCNEDCKSYG